jgi:hypothetical protein
MRSPRLPVVKPALSRLLKVAGGIGVLVTGAAVAGLITAGSTYGGVPTCDKYASPSGSNANSGSATAPYATVQYLSDHLASGQTGCLFAGSYVGNLSAANSGVTIASAPGQRAKLLGYIWIKSTANNYTLQDLDIDGHDVSPPPVQINGDYVTLTGLDITDRNKPGTSYNGMCVLAGPNFETSSANTAYNLTIQGNRIHNCGDDAHEHAIYLESTRNAYVADNYLYDNPGYGIHMYPDSQGSVIEYDVIDGNSSKCKANLTFSGESPGGEYAVAHGSSNNVVRYSIVTNSLCRYNVESYFPTGSSTPVGNIVENSCVWNAPSGNYGYLTTDSGSVAYTQRNNLNVNPQFVDRANKNFALQAGSPCAGYGPRSASPPTTTTTTTATTTTATTTTTTTTTPTTPQTADFSVSASPTSASVSRGSQIRFTTSISPLNGFTSPVSLTVTGLPSGATGAFTTDPAMSSSTLVVSTLRTTPRGWYTLTVQGTAGTLAHDAQIALRVRN